MDDDTTPTLPPYLQPGATDETTPSQPTNPADQPEPTGNVATPDPAVEDTAIYAEDIEPPEKVVQLPGTKRDITDQVLKKRAPLDKERLRLDYTTGSLTVREIGTKHGITHGRVVQIAKKGTDGVPWQRDSSALARGRASQLLNLASAQRMNAAQSEERRKAEIEKANKAPLTSKAANLPKDLPVVTASVELAAAVMVQIRLEHRDRLKDYRSLAEKLLGELAFATDRPDVLQNVADAMYLPDEYGRDKLYDTYMKVMALPTRIKGMKDLTDVLAKLIMLERQAFDLDAPTEDADQRPPPDRTLTPAETYAWFAAQKPALKLASWGGK